MRLHIPSLLPLLLALSLTLTLTACAPRHSISLASRVFPEAASAGKVCYLVPHGYRLSRDSPDFKEYAGYVARALAERGYTVTDDVTKANLAVALTYGMSAPQVVSYTGTRAVYGYRPAYAGQPNYVPNHQKIYTVTGYEPVTYANVFYMARLGLSARALLPAGGSGSGMVPGERVWDVNVTDSSPNDDLREAFAAMLAAALEYIGVDSERIVDIDIKNNDPRMKAVRELMAPSPPPS